MKRILTPIALLLVLALAVSACGVTATSDAARVNGASVTIAQLNQTIHDATSSAPFDCLLSSQSAVAGAGVHQTYSAKFVAQQLGLLVQQEVLNREVARLHLASTPLATQLAEGQLASGLTGATGSSCSSTGATVLAALSPTYRNLLLGLQRDQDLLSAYVEGGTLTPAGVAAFAAAHPSVADQACVSVILVAKRATALSLEARLRTGSSFSALAKANSLDATTAANGGAVGCDYPGQFAGALATVIGSIGLNQPSAPSLFNSQYVIVEVTQRQAGSSSGAGLALVSAAANAEIALVNAAGHADSVWINSTYGTWSTTGGQNQVVSPAGPLNTLVLNPASLTPTGDTYK